MASLKKLLLLFTILLACNIIFGQNTSQKRNPLLNTRQSLNNQFLNVISESTEYKNYKVINNEWINTLKSNTLDSIQAYQQNIRNLRRSVNSQLQEINELKARLSQTKQASTFPDLSKSTLSDGKDSLLFKIRPLSHQFEYVSLNSNDYENFKLVESSWLNSLKTNTLDTLLVVNDELQKSKDIIQKQSKEILDLRNPSLTPQNATDSSIDNNTIEIFGLEFNKNSFSFLAIGIIVTLLTLLLILIYKYSNNVKSTKLAEQTLTDIENEFAEHKRIALEREQKVRRQLQDEINKHK